MRIDLEAVCKHNNGDITVGEIRCGKFLIKSYDLAYCYRDSEVEHETMLAFVEDLKRLLNEDNS